MASSESQIDTIRQHFIYRRPQPEAAANAQVSKETVKRYYKRFREEGVKQKDPEECEGVIIAIPEVSPALPTRARLNELERVKTEKMTPFPSHHELTRESTIAKLCDTLKETEEMYNKAVRDAENNPTKDWAVVKHNEARINIIKEMGKYCGLDKGKLMDDSSNATSINVNKVNDIKRKLDEHPELITQLFN